jgi:hypothetical protein
MRERICSRARASHSRKHACNCACAQGPWMSEASVAAVVDTNLYVGGLFENSIMVDNADNVLAAGGLVAPLH